MPAGAPLSVKPEHCAPRMCDCHDMIRTICWVATPRAASPRTCWLRYTQHSQYCVQLLVVCRLYCTQVLCSWFGATKGLLSLLQLAFPPTRSPLPLLLYPPTRAPPLLLLQLYRTVLAPSSVRLCAPSRSSPPLLASFLASRAPPPPQAHLPASAERPPPTRAPSALDLGIIFPTAVLISRVECIVISPSYSRPPYNPAPDKLQLWTRDKLVTTEVLTFPFWRSQYSTSHDTARPFASVQPAPAALLARQQTSKVV